MSNLEIKFDNTLHTINFGIGEIDSLGVRKITLQLAEWNYPYLPDWWEWKACVPRGKLSGTFIKRLSKYYHTEYGKKLKQEHASYLGSLIGAHSFKNEEFYFRFTTDDWQSGEFGDEGSCYWTDRTYNRIVLRECGMKAVQFFGKDENGDLYGYARAFIIKHPKKYDYIVFNGYGLETIKIARIVSQHLGIQYRQILLHNHGEAQDSLYFNNGGKAAYVLARNIQTYAEPPELTEVDLNICIDDYVKNCKWCDDIFVLEEMRDDFCKTCHDTTQLCQDCNSRYYISNLYDIGDTKVCYHCYQQYKHCNGFEQNCDVHAKDLECHRNVYYCKKCLEKVLLHDLMNLDNKSSSSLLSSKISPCAYSSNYNTSSTFFKSFLELSSNSRTNR